MGTRFCIRVKINGCEGRHLKIAFWYDSRSKNINNRFYKIDSGVEQQDLALGKEGIQTWKISSPSLWTSLQKLVKEHGSSSKSEYARIMFTISEIDTLCDNNKEYKKDHPLHGQIFPEKTDNTTASIPNTTEYKALFLDSSKKNPLTDIISYTDQAYLSLQRINSPEDTQVKDLELRLWENKTGEDTLLQKIKISSFDKEGFIVPHPVDMSQITKTKQKNQSKTLPRFFYLQLNKMKDNKVDKIIYTYPEGYKTGKDNDSEIIILQKDDYTVEDIKGDPFNANIVTSAKWIHDVNQRLIKGEDQKEFDEKEFNAKAAEQRNKDAQIKNTATLDKSKNYFLQLKVAEDPTIQKSRYIRTGKQVGVAGSNFETSNNTKCVCEERIRAFMQMLRVGEGTVGESGYKKAFRGNIITDLSKHPEKNYGGSTAAGAYQIMRYTWWYLNGEQVKQNETGSYYKTAKYEENHDYVKRYKIPDYSALSQDKLCIVILKHSRPGILALIQQGKIEEAIRTYGSLEWASLPHNGDYSKYKYKGKLQPATPMKKCLINYTKYFEDELKGITTLHLEKGFMRDFNLICMCQNQVAETQAPLNNAEYDIEKAVSKLNSRAKSGSTGWCAAYVRIAIEAGGLSTVGRPGTATGYDTFLPKLGFQEVSFEDNYKPIKGDIAVTKAFTGDKVHSDGHISMYNGFQWVSDFKQRDIWAGEDYRKYKPKTLIFRWKK